MPSSLGAYWAESTRHLTRPARPFAFEILWRGVIYGIVDALLLSAFPGLIAWELMQRNIVWRLAGATGYGVLTLALVWIITATNHAGVPRTPRTSPAF